MVGDTLIITVEAIGQDIITDIGTDITMDITTAADITITDTTIIIRITTEHTGIVRAEGTEQADETITMPIIPIETMEQSIVPMSDETAQTVQQRTELP
jgi:hypothetical protein